MSWSVDEESGRVGRLGGGISSQDLLACADLDGAVAAGGAHEALDRPAGVLTASCAPRKGRHRTSGRRKPSDHLVGEDHLIAKSSQVFRSHIQAGSPIYLGQP